MTSHEDIDTQHRAAHLSPRLPKRRRTLLYRSFFRLGQVAQPWAIRPSILHPERIDFNGPAVLASNHISHNDPMLLSISIERQIDWMARSEFFAHPIMSTLLTSLDCIPIDRTRFPLPGIREALRRLEKGHIVGVFPEGELSRGDKSMLSNAKIKQGAAFLSIHSRAPIIPCAILGSTDFNRVPPWLPFTHSGDFYIAFGKAIHSHRDTRHEMTEKIADSIRELHQELLTTFSIPEKFRSP